MRRSYERIEFDDEELDWTGPGWYVARWCYSQENGDDGAARRGASAPAGDDDGRFRWSRNDHGENRVYLSDPTDLMMPVEQIAQEKHDDHRPSTLSRIILE